jgi:sec-independent protein translocase protein TatA
LLGLVVLLVFGPKRLPEMGRSMGRGLREFKDSVSGDRKDDLDFVFPPEEAQATEVVAVVAVTETAASVPEPQRPRVAVATEREDKRVA